MAVTLLARLNCARLGASRLNYLGNYTQVSVNGFYIDGIALVKSSLRVDLNLNSTPSTASFRVKNEFIGISPPFDVIYFAYDNTGAGLRPAEWVGLPVSITTGVPIFGGFVVRVSLVTLAANAGPKTWAFDIECQDALWLMRGKTIWKRYATTLGDTLQSAIRDVVATVGGGLTSTNVQNIELGGGAGSFDVTFTGDSCASALSTLMGLSNSGLYRFDALNNLHAWTAAHPDTGQTDPTLVGAAIGAMQLVSDGTQQRATILAKGIPVRSRSTVAFASPISFPIDQVGMLPNTSPRASGDLIITPRGTVFSAPYVVGNSPAPAPSINATAAGSVDLGSHVYAVVYRDAVGVTAVSTNPANLLTYTVGGIPLTITLNIPVSSYGGTTARDMYRSKANTSSPLYLVGSVNDNSTTTFVDNIADASLGAIAPSVGTNLVLLTATYLTGPSAAIGAGDTLAYVYTTGGYPGTAPVLTMTFPSALTYDALLAAANATLAQFSSVENKLATDIYSPYANPGRVLTNSRNYGDSLFSGTYAIQKVRVTEFGICTQPPGVPLQALAGQLPKRSVEASLTRFGLIDFLSSLGA